MAIVRLGLERALWSVAYRVAYSELRRVLQIVFLRSVRDADEFWNSHILEALVRVNWKVYA